MEFLLISAQLSSKRKALCIWLSFYYYMTIRGKKVQNFFFENLNDPLPLKDPNIFYNSSVAAVDYWEFLLFFCHKLDKNHINFFFFHNARLFNKWSLQKSKWEQKKRHKMSWKVAKINRRNLWGWWVNGRFLRQKSVFFLFSFSFLIMIKIYSFNLSFVKFTVKNWV